MQLNISLKKILEIVDGQSQVDPSLIIQNITSLRNARESDLAVVFDPEINSVFDNTSLSEVKLSRAGVIIASSSLVDNKEFIVVKDPLMAYQKLVDFAKNNIDYSVHKTAILHETVILEDDVYIGAGTIVEKNARIGDHTRIGAQSYIGENVRLGSNVLIYPGVKILDGSFIGDNSIIHSGVVIGSDGFGFRASAQGMRKVPQIGTVRIGRDVEIGANTCIDRSTFDETIISDGVKIDNQVHIAHNVHIGPHTAIIAQTAIAGSVRIGAGCMIGGQVGIKDHVTIGNGVKVVSKAGIMKNIGDGEIVAGAPAMPFSRWKRVKIAEAGLPEFIKQGNELKRRLSEKRSILKTIFGK